MNRKQRRARQKVLKKSGSQRIESVEKAVSAMPTKCDECGTPFDGSKANHLDRWRIAAYDDGRVHLVCPQCVPDNIRDQVPES